LAPVIVEQLFERMSDLKQQGLTLLLVDQMAGLAMSMADQVHLLQSGQLKFNGTPQSLLDSGLLEQSYLHEHETSTASPSI
jgi:ABC-type branched-subunit amino acid transport system ATPase component